MLRFRLMTESELAFTASLRNRRRRLVPMQVCYTQAGNFTQALVEDTNGNFHMGVAKRNPIDQDNPEIAEHVALARALRAPSIRRP